MVENENSAGANPGIGKVVAVFVILGIVVAGLLFMMGSWLKRSEVKMLSVGQSIPDFSMTSFSGESYRLSDLKSKIILVNIWSSWCTSCDEEALMLQEVWTEVEDSGYYLFLGLDYVDTEKPALAFIQEHGVTYPNGPDIGSNISKMFKIQGVPESFLIGKDGTLKAIQIGAFILSVDVREFLTLAKD